ncbi:MAG: hypothetical protein MJ252_22225 [archaeon]|nr:hypothetical protein [archaeon]
MKQFFYLLSLLLLVGVSPIKILLPHRDISIRNMNINNDWDFKFSSDSDWKRIDLPHDYSIIQEFDEHNEAESGFLPGGDVIYRKEITLEKPTEDAKIMIYFYGSYKDTTLTVNGNYVGENHYGYNSFGFDITKYFKFGEKNELLVNVSHELPSSRWYSGSGIFRDVELIITGMVHVDMDGLKITTPDIESGKGTVLVEAEVKNEKDEKANVKLNVKIEDKEGKTVASLDSKTVWSIDPHSVQVVKGTLEVPNPTLWYDTDPYLYTLKLELQNELLEPLDHYQNKFGFRFFRFDQSGFFLNNRATKLNGVSNHHDHGAIGSVDNYDAVYRKFIQLKDMGMNSIRTTHNIASKHWIEIADEIGILIVEEFFDGWSYSKNGNKNDFGKYFKVLIEDKNEIYGKENNMTWYEFCVKSVIKRDRNNPSIIMWSMGNELATGASIDENYPKFCQRMMDLGKQFDTTRPFTTGDNNSFHDKPNKYHTQIAELISQYKGIQGYNYPNQDQLKKGAEKYGAVYISESASAINTRGIYNVYKNGDHDGKYHLTSYDLSAVSWGYTAHRALWYTLANDFTSGQYIWTGHDYIGEPTPWNGNNPGSVTGKGPLPNSAYFGIVDTAGFPKDTYYLYRAQQNHKSTTVHLVTAWDDKNIFYTDEKQLKTPVWVYSNAFIVLIFRSDMDKVLCFMNQRKVTTASGHIYYTYTSTTNDKDLCEIVEDSGDLGSNLYGRFNIAFKKDTKIYTMAYDESGKIIPEEKIIGNYKVKAPTLEDIGIKAIADKKTLKANGHSLAFVEISLEDSEGNLNTVGENLLIFKLEGEGKILGVDNGDQATIDKYQQKSVLKDTKNAQIKCFAGKALIILSSTRTAGKIKLTISSEGLKDTYVEIDTQTE